MPLQIPYGILFELIINNCHMFLGDDVIIDIVSQTGGGGYTTHVLVTDRGKRSAAFSSSCSNTLQGALDDLHDKTAQAVTRYIEETGFDAVPRVTTRTAPSFGGGAAGTSGSTSRKVPLEETEVISMDESSSSSDESDVSDTGEPFKTPLRGSVPGISSARVGGSMTAVKAQGKSPVGRGPPPHLQGSVIANHQAIAPVLSCPPASRRPLAYLSGSSIPPPSASGPRSSLPHDVRVRHAPDLVQGPVLHTRGVVHAKPTAVKMEDTAKPTLRRNGFMICVNWVGHDELSVLDECFFSQTSLRNAAIKLVRTRAREFKHVTDADFAIAQRGGLACAIKRMQVGGTTYQLANFPDDLSALYADSSSCPRVEVEVNSIIPSAGAAAGPVRLPPADPQKP
ncbi:hypothetical protein S7711_03029 [Stachybotrys chartarum IBT 7711]|uniref:Uncharacterized protein n=1 Tax=Stachybotrys chartarum (strain CBS 109288 / IBT 7711) TaxID=1280523 RepID=A0A084APE0_STACB|nr:hypothetical protein S7711_03029 [Stachybotrys chartarum IBT 7711]KFA46781.1 hypothetical protein S40293_06801 [Stachybotrys chartarum IBT 40293]